MHDPLRLLFIAGLLIGCAGRPPAAQPAVEPGHAAGSQPHHGHANHAGHQHRFADAEAWARRFDAPERDAWQKPAAVVEHLKLAPTARIVDVGAGTGYFAVRFAKAVPRGMVYGADIEQSMVEYLDARAKRAGLGNVKGVKATPAGVTLPEPVDLIFLCNTYHHIGARTAWIQRIGAQLKTGGRIAIVDFKPEDDGPGPPNHMRLPIDAVTAEFAAAGFTRTDRNTDLLPRQYVLTFERTR